MRQMFIQTELYNKMIEGTVDNVMTQLAKEDAEVEKLVMENAPWASRWVWVDGGIKAFESILEYETWMNQV